MPLNVAATSVKLAIPPPITRALLRPSGSAVAHCKTIMCLVAQQRRCLIKHLKICSKCSSNIWQPFISFLFKHSLSMQELALVGHK